MFEEDFIVRTSREGSIPTNQQIEAIITTLGCIVMNSRNLGSVVVTADLENGQISRENVRWAQDNSPGFDKDLGVEAQNLLQAVKGALLASGNGPGDLKIKIVGKK